MWYGQPEVKTNNLYLSFAQFNFLDTDAAVSLADSATRIEEDFPKLLVGPRSSETWRNIEKLAGAVSSELRSIRQREVDANEEAAVIDRQLTEVSDIRQESDSICARLGQMIRRVGWSAVEDDKKALAGALVEALSELVPLAQQAAALDWTESPVSINGLAKYCCDGQATSEKVEAGIARLEVLRDKQRRLADSVEHDRDALALVGQVRRLIDAEVPRRAAERDELQKRVATYSGWLAGLDSGALGVLSATESDMPVAARRRAAILESSAASALLATAKEEHSSFSRLRDQSLSLAQELRGVAARILRNSPEPDECPLCHTRFGPGDLAKHMSVGIDEQAEEAGQALLAQLREREAAAHTAAVVEAASGWPGCSVNGQAFPRTSRFALR